MNQNLYENLNTPKNENFFDVSEKRGGKNSEKIKQIMVRLTESEKDKLTIKVLESGMTQQEYVTNSILGKEIISLNGVTELSTQIARIGSNLNQLVRAVNVCLKQHPEKGFTLSEPQYDTVLKACKGVQEVWQLLNALNSR